MTLVDVGSTDCRIRDKEQQVLLLHLAVPGFNIRSKAEEVKGTWAAGCCGAHALALLTKSLRCDGALCLSQTRMALGLRISRSRFTRRHSQTLKPKPVARDPTPGS